jgi:predicted DNA-binding transcriptional regulator YafY
MVVNILKEAIEKRKKVEIIYENSVRIVDPYLVGINQKDHISLRAFQTGGQSSSGNLPSWRLFLIEKIDAIKILDEQFALNSQYNPNDKQMKQIHYRIERESTE